MKTTLLVIILLFILYIHYCHKYCSPKIKKIYTIDMVKDNFETGDLILVSSNQNYSDNIMSYIPYLNHDYINRIIGTGKEWNHVAVFVKINGEPYVYDTCSYLPKWIPYDFTLNEHKESGFISLPKYVDYLNGYLGIRKLKKSYAPQDRSIFLDIIKTHNKNMRFSLDYIKIFKKPQIFERA